MRYSNSIKPISSANEIPLICSEKLSSLLARITIPTLAIQMIVFNLVTMLYIPCFATIIIIAKQTTWKYALKISVLEIAIALLIGGIINWAYVIFSSL